MSKEPQNQVSIQRVEYVHDILCTYVTNQYVLTLIMYD
jgi:hypothetical protein